MTIKAVQSLLNVITLTPVKEIVNIFPYTCDVFWQAIKISIRWEIIHIIVGELYRNNFLTENPYDSISVKLSHFHLRL